MNTPFRRLRLSIRLTSLLGLLGAALATQAASNEVARYELTTDSLRQAEAPHGRIEGPFEFHSRIFADTVRRYWIYVPVLYDAARPASLLVFQDGQRALNPEGSLRVQNVLDNLIRKREIPVTIGVFITPGNRSTHYPDDLGMANPDHRAQEYDALDDRYARFLVEELLPEVRKQYKITDDPEQHAIGGTSSGAICAFTVAWHRPDVFRKVISSIGSFVSIGYRPASGGKPMVPGGDLYPTLIRKSPIRPLRIFLQDGSNDLSNEHGDWFLANQQMLSALNWANSNADREHRSGPRYDVKHAWGEGGHSDDHGGALLPDIMRWLWRDDAAAATQ
jgi:hypothetical protein